MLTDVDEVEKLIASWSEALGHDSTAYKNHIYRVINLCAALRQLSEEELRQVVIAACFHDVAIWLDDTFDYLTPSRQHAEHYLEEQGHGEWAEVVGAMIEQHHKITRYPQHPLVETFRHADWIDVSLGIIKFGLTSKTIKEIRATFPNSGFHPFLLRRTGRELLSRPWNPLPMVRW